MPLYSISRPTQAPSGAAATLVLLHGLASDEKDLMAIVPELDSRLNAVSFRAPYETGYGGYGWFPIEFMPDGRRLIDEPAAAASLATLISALEPFEGTHLILGGFSQGGMMAAGALLARPDLVSAAWLMSSMLLPIWETAGPAAVTRPVLVQHGTFDPVVDPADGARLAESLAISGHDVTYREYPMAHQISYESLIDAQGWLSRLLPA